MPTFYQCDRCTACCRWPGEVKITDQEIEAIAAFLGIATNQFIQRFTRLRSNRQGLALQDKPNHECIFLEEGDCQIQSVKPMQCRGFPNVWNFPGFQNSCRAIPIELDEDEYEKRLQASLTPGPLAPRKTTA